MSLVDTTSIKQISILEIAKKLGIRRKGLQAMCFANHDDRTASLSFIPDKNYWRCYGSCGKHGDGIQLVMEVLSIDFKSALDWFSANFGVINNVNLKRPPSSGRRGQSVLPPISGTKLEREFLSDGEVYKWLIRRCALVSAPRGVQYLKSHGITLEAATRFGLRELRDPARAMQGLIKQWGIERVRRSGLVIGGNARSHRLIWNSYALLFPFYVDDAVIYIQGRVFEENSKFMSLRGITKPLYNVQRLQTLRTSERVHICEGIPDALALETIGLTAVAVLGATSFRPEWVDSFMKFDVALLPDGDAGGERFWSTISTLFVGRGKAVKRINVPKGKDVADVVAQLGGA